LNIFDKEILQKYTQAKIKKSFAALGYNNKLECLKHRLFNFTCHSYE